MSEAVSLRLARDDDKAFLEYLYTETRKNQFDALGLPNHLREVLLQQQFSAQIQAYNQSYKQADHYIIEYGGRNIGRIITQKQTDYRHIIDIMILPSYQRRGIGHHLLQEFINDSLKDHTPIILSVEIGNPAINLYRRLGFEVEAQTELHIKMRRKP